MLGRLRVWLLIALVVNVTTLGAASINAVAGDAIVDPTSLVVPGVETLDSGQQTRGEEEVRATDPELRLQREASEAKFAGENAVEALRTDEQQLHGALVTPTPSAPAVQPGDRVVSYLNSHAARVRLSNGGRGVVESLTPIARTTASGGVAALDLTLEQSSDGYVARSAAAPVVIPQNLQDGVALADTGLVLTPVDKSGQELAGTASVTAGAALYTNTQLDTDTVIKPTTTGFEVFSVLRSAASPSVVEFSFALPAGAELVEDHGTIVVQEEGQSVAVVSPASARDALGVSVPVVMSTRGGVLTVKVDKGQGDYQYPITIDPTVNDTRLHFEWEAGNWGFETDFSSIYKASEASGTLVDKGSEGVPFESYGLFRYITQKASRIYGFITETSSTYTGGGKISNVIEMINSSLGVEAKTEFPNNYGRTRTELCPSGGCTSTKGSNENAVLYEQVDTAPGLGTAFTATMYTATVEISQTEGPTAKFNTESATISGESNVLHSPSSWMGPNRGVFEVNFKDPGLGISEWKYHSAAEPGWDRTERPYCEGVQCNETRNLTFSYYGVKEGCCTGWWNGKNLPDGEDSVEIKDANPTGSSATATTTVKVDGTAPHEFTLTGLPPNLEIGNAVYHLRATAKDGSGTTPSSGVASLALAVDGVPVGRSGGSCSPGPCTASTEWTISGSEFGVGQHEVTVTGTDYTLNAGVGRFVMYVSRPTQPLPAGPGVVDPQSGELSLVSDDVALGAPEAGLTFARSYGSLHLTAGSAGPLGPQWDMNLGGGENLTKLPNGDMLLTGGTGLQALFASRGEGTFTSPNGDQSLTLAEQTVERIVQFTLRDGSGATTTFTPVTGGSSTVWMPSRRESTAGTGTTSVSYEVVRGITRPTLVLAPVPTGVTCSPELKPGCRELTFNYATSTTATGETPASWGDYFGRLTRVYFTAWDPATSRMVTTTVAQYSYDNTGKLRAEWDPRISPALKTTYGYDGEGHVVAVSTSGRQPWLLNYGTIQGDARTGRLLSAARPAASTAFGSGSKPTNTSAPEITPNPLSMGNTISVSTGNWNNGALAYDYQWENCNSAGAECKPIVGAVNRTYTIVPSNAGHKLVAQVTAVNAAGTALATSSATSVVPYPTRFYYAFGGEGSGDGQFREPGGVAVDASGSVWVVDSGNNRVEKFDPVGKFLASYGSAGTGNLQFKTPTGIAIDRYTGKIYVADTGNNRVEVLDREGRYSSKFGSEGTGNGQFKAPAGIAISNENETIYVVDRGNKRVEEFTLSSYAYKAQWTGSYVGELREPEGIASVRSGYTGAFGFVVGDTGNNRGVEGYEGIYCSFYCIAFGEEGTGPEQMSSPWGVAASGYYGESTYIVNKGSARIQQYYSGGYFSEEFGSRGSGYFGQFREPTWVAEAQEGSYYESLYISDTGNNRIVLVSPHTVVPDPPMEWQYPGRYGSTAVTTLEYKIPVSGPHAPYQLGATETATWAQTDNPVEGTAVFPPDEPVGWPAQDYRRASIVYLDAIGRQVNTANPGGAIGTTEYNSYNEVTRVLSPHARAVALGEGARSAEVARQLDTQNTYNTGTEAGLELTSILGPLHRVKLTNGTEVEARAHTEYFYDEGAPAEGGPYRLVTKATTGAQIAGRTEEDIHTTTTQYGGQENLGWRIHQPTSVTVDPAGLKLVQSTVYDPNTGNVVETRAAGGAPDRLAPTSSSQFGSAGTGNGQFDHAEADALDASGNVWVADGNNNRVQEFTSTGTFIAAFGTAGTGNGQFKHPAGIAINRGAGNVYVADTNNNRVQELNARGEYVRQWGTAGTGNGQFKTPTGVAIDASGNVWISDTENGRVQEFNSEGRYLRQFGSEGTGNGQFEGPGGIAISNGNVYVADYANDRVQEFTSSGAYVAQFGTTGNGSGQFHGPWGLATDPITGNIFVADSGENNRVEEFDQNGTFVQEFGSYGTGSGHFWGATGLVVASTGAIYVVDEYNKRVDIWTQTSPHDTQMVYYTAGANSQATACGEHPEWANMPCESRVAAQPTTEGFPELPVTAVTYNMWGEPLVTTDTVGTTTRTGTNTYDAAGRLLNAEISSTVGVASPAVTNEYNSETGDLSGQKATIEGRAEQLSMVLNSLGQAIEYVDADGNISTATYDIDGRTSRRTDGKGTQTFAYDATSGLISKLTDSAAGSFTATYDQESELTTEAYPNGMNVNRTYDVTGAITGIEYVKTTHCTEKCVWYSDQASRSITDQWMSQTSTFSTQAYRYDNVGRLVQVQDTPVGLGCTTRIYAYDIETNRTGMTTRAPEGGGGCAASGGTSETHSYDSANRLVDVGIAYDTFGRITNLPSADAGGSTLTSTYYTDDKVASQTQNGLTVGYYRDPSGRVRENIQTGTKNATIISHYSGAGDEPSWTIDGSGNWSRNISGIGGFAATQYNGEAPVLQIEDLHGDIVATAPISETATGLASSNDTTEYGVPRGESSPQYSWLGGDLRSTEFNTGIIAMGVRSYVPQIGRFLQTDPVSGGSANAYAYTFGDPVSNSDPSGEYSATWFEGVGGIVAKEAMEAEAAREEAARIEAEEKARAAEAAAAAAAEAMWGYGGGGGQGGGSPVARAAGGNPAYPCFKKSVKWTYKDASGGITVRWCDWRGDRTNIFYDGIDAKCDGKPKIGDEWVSSNGCTGWDKTWGYNWKLKDVVIRSTQVYHNEITSTDDVLPSIGGGEQVKFKCSIRIRSTGKAKGLCRQDGPPVKF